MTPHKNMSAKGICSYPNLKWPTENEISAKKNILLLVSYT